MGSERYLPTDYNPELLPTVSTSGELYDLQALWEKWPQGPSRVYNCGLITRDCSICWLFGDSGITHFDLANIYGPPKGEAERFFGKILRHEFDGHRDQMVISTKAGWPMWDGPYGDFGSRKHLISSLDQSLSRMGLEYVDIFYHHRPDLPLEETM